jgi:hypothetical protein
MNRVRMRSSGAAYIEQAVPADAALGVKGGYISIGVKA